MGQNRTIVNISVEKQNNKLEEATQQIIFPPIHTARNLLFAFELIRRTNSLSVINEIKY